MRLTARLAAFLILFTASAADAQTDPADQAFKSGDYATAYRLFLPQAEQGDPQAQMHIGWMYEQGRGVPQDYGKAYSWYTIAATQNNVVAQNNLNRWLWNYINGCIYYDLLF